jgi:hypothetical protein
MKASQVSISIMPIAAPQRARPNMWPIAAKINGTRANPAGSITKFFAILKQAAATDARAIVTINRPKLN